jgi:hypothetical protein
MPNMAVVAPKLSKLIPMLATDHDGEVVATVRAISRTLKGAGLDFHSLVEALGEHKSTYAPPPPPRKAQAPTPQPTSLRDIAIWLRTHAAHRMNYKEQSFVIEMTSRLGTGRRASKKQENWLRSLYYWYGGDVR